MIDGYKNVDNLDKVDYLEKYQEERLLKNMLLSLFNRINDNQFFRLSLCNSANGGKAWIYGLSRHLSFREILGISLSVLA